MNLVDANVLLVATNRSDHRHGAARGWLDGALGGPETVGFAWIVVVAFLRLSTKVGLFPRPLAVGDAVEVVGRWLEQPGSVRVDPSTRHFALLSGLLSEVGTGGNLVNDAHLAALAIEHDAAVVTFDRDFGRFAGVRWRAPS